MVNEQTIDILNELKRDYSNEKFEILKESLSSIERSNYQDLLFGFESQLNDYVSTFRNKIRHSSKIDEDDSDNILNEIEQNKVSYSSVEAISDLLQEKYDIYAGEMLLTQMHTLVDLLTDQMHN